MARNRETEPDCDGKEEKTVSGAVFGWGQSEAGTFTRAKNYGPQASGSERATSLRAVEHFLPFLMPCSCARSQIRVSLGRQKNNVHDGISGPVYSTPSTGERNGILFLLVSFKL